tara:strand:+ start:2076 stop:3218 length:1143 start_codon:yes stop_codon:yes gene_type:complete
MPSGVYPDFKRGGKIPHPAAGLSKNKYNAKGEIIQRKSRSKLKESAQEKLGATVTNQKELATAVGRHMLPKLADLGGGIQTPFDGKGLAQNQLLQQLQPSKDVSAMKTLAPGISKDVDMSIIPDWARQIGRKPKLSSATVNDDNDNTTPQDNLGLVNTIDNPNIARAIMKAAIDPRRVHHSSRKLGSRVPGFGSIKNPQDFGDMAEFLTKSGQVRKRAKGGGRKKKTPSPVEQAIGLTIDEVDTTEVEPPNIPESRALGQVIQNQPQTTGLLDAIDVEPEDQNVEEVSPLIAAMAKVEPEEPQRESSMDDLLGDLMMGMSDEEAEVSDEEGEEMNVEEMEYNGETYYVGSDNNIYDIDTGDVIGEWLGRHWASGGEPRMN